MKYQKPVTVLVLLITIMAGVASSIGIFSTGGPGPYEYESIRRETVQIYGEGLYRQMSEDVAPQGIAQDYVTLFIAIPFLWISFFRARSGSLRGRFLLAGALGYLPVLLGYGNVQHSISAVCSPAWNLVFWFIPGDAFF
ncbi:MAG: hypothetical protein RI575_10130 [Balneolaceae bacterium]|nr:hypothetical protein [Balneolaceae bacterium]MDR9407809.1 hypothetical protein [Balneolaceae bacterium]